MRRVWRRFRGFVAALIVTAIVTVSGIGAFLYFKNDALVFHPIPFVRHDPTELGLEYEAVTIDTDDGEQLAAWYLPGADARGAILYFHGNAGNIGDRMPALAGLAPLGLDILIVDYRGYGDSTGSPSETGTYEDARASWHYLTKSRAIPEDRIVIWGRSLGGAVAIALASEVQPAALVVESTFTSVVDLGEEIYPSLPVRSWAKVRYPSLQRMPSIGAPLLLAHSADDTLVGLHHGRALFEAAGGPKRFVEMHGGHNAGHLTLPRYRAAVAAFLTEVMP